MSAADRRFSETLRLTATDPTAADQLIGKLGAERGLQRGGRPRLLGGDGVVQLAQALLDLRAELVDFGRIGHEVSGLVLGDERAEVLR